ncbi:hypothetical protein AB0N81_31660 [Streptomyces sp. NPDC093510]|uniref:hypothetical protein n=1 Tax=Streptomyces sp. NPDC093510 TaxID=3155199 RepID=UPI00342F7243
MLGRASTCLPLPRFRLGPAGDATAVIAAQLRAVVERLIAAGQWVPGDPEVVIVGGDQHRSQPLDADAPLVQAAVHPAMTTPALKRECRIDW